RDGAGSDAPRARPFPQLVMPVDSDVHDVGAGRSQSGRRFDAGTHQTSTGALRPRNSNCGSCKNGNSPAGLEAPATRAAATMDEKRTSPARARLQSRAATLT